MLKKDKSRYYVRNKDLLREVINYNKTSIASDSLAKMLMSIATSYLSKGSFAGYTWREDMVSEAVLTCLKYLKNFNSEKSQNAFAYVTQICKNSFKAYIKNQTKHRNIKDICYKNSNVLINDQIFYASKGINYELLIDKPKKAVRKKE